MVVEKVCAHDRGTVAVKRLVNAHCLLRLRHDVEVAEVVEMSRFPDLGGEKVIVMGLLRLVSAAKVLSMEDCGDYNVVLEFSWEEQVSQWAV